MDAERLGAAAWMQLREMPETTRQPTSQQPNGASEVTTLKQALSRMHNGHADILKAICASRTLITPQTSSGDIRGLKTALKTLRRWNAVSRDDALTEFGHALLAAWTEKYNGRFERPVDVTVGYSWAI